MQKHNSSLSLEKKKPHIGIDLLGSDLCPSVLLEALLASLPLIPKNTNLTIFLRKEDLNTPLPTGMQAVFAEEAITMEDHPLSVLRKKKNSSISLGMQMLKEGKIDAFISSGNTGAILAAAKTILKTIKGIPRPALTAFLPAKNKKVAALDVGANTKCHPSQLVAFARLGIALQMAAGIDKPSFALLNIGSEEGKGTPEHRAAYDALSKIPQHIATFAGNVEGRDVFDGPADVIITDGFTGNVFLKTAEGVASFFYKELAEQLHQDPLLSPQAAKIINALQARFDYTKQPGALLLGVQGLVLKCHGNASPQSYLSSIQQTLYFLQENTLEKITQNLSLCK